jgi:fido (protein-threonine AMPylation protein)
LLWRSDHRSGRSLDSARPQRNDPFPFHSYQWPLTYYLAEINATHPFREGNGRTQRAFLQQLAEDAGYRIDWRTLDPLHAPQPRHQEVTARRQLSMHVIAAIP